MLKAFSFVSLKVAAQLTIRCWLKLHSDVGFGCYKILA